MKLKFTLALFVLVCASAFCGSALSYVPSNANLIVCLNLAAISAQPELKALFDSQMKNCPNYASELSQALGIDPCKQISNITLFLDQSNHHGFILDGTFSCRNLSKLIQTNEEMSAKFEVNDLESVQMVRCKSGGDMQILFIDDGTMAIGDSQTLAVIAGVSSHKTNDINSNKSFKGLSPLVKTSACIWGVILPSKDNKQAAVSVLSDGFQKMRGSFFSLDYSENFSFNFAGLVGKSAELPQLKAALTNFLDAFRGWVVSVPEMSEILKYARVEDDQKNLARIFVSIPAEQFKASMSKIADQTGKKATN